ncbi:Lrp/AsnC family transcriptional regulator [Desulfohalobium retbaense]|uniref:Transcriptional regulator, AsnC family n=1 Tax=Desulfohalobium retbaense (strain ATCC 49708 / DSM 5692 / JCM 16813 / HR100) TaxID=485915 RepID=C8X4L9_DESRD|nr:Lrp/AsnC family transcriptional regulator [Desulfohalobium retbaense]ACV69242.1 transcriptional regulator, AsnC family [Desulfohalobium retbaense DSM 5692]
MIDDTDRHILHILQENARASNASIARQIGMAPSAVLERIRKLEKRGVIQGYEVKLNAKKLGLALTAFIRVGSEERVGSTQTGRNLAQLPEVQEVHHVAGPDCYLVKVHVPDNESLGQLLQRFGAIEGVSYTHTVLVLTPIKESAPLPLPEPHPAS